MLIRLLTSTREAQVTDSGAGGRDEKTDRRRMGKCEACFPSVKFRFT